MILQVENVLIENYQSHLHLLEKKKMWNSELGIVCVPKP